jgi:hypothetical protein
MNYICGQNLLYYFTLKKQVKIVKSVTKQVCGVIMSKDSYKMQQLRKERSAVGHRANCAM